MTAAEKIREKDTQVIIMFVTNMINYAIRGYSVDAMDYILKTINYFSFSQKLDRAIERINRRKSPVISIPVSGGMHKIDVSDIYYIESQGHTLLFQTRKGEIFIV
ncbi:MAG TPA: hypothetical protein DIT54_05120 [Lachnospiraceae bacterium]|nr:hypothetical protein [Lachnospiraceae bacterium]